MEYYEIIEDGNPIGKACIEQEGLYYKITCRLYKGVDCKRIYLHSNSGTVCLGYCIPVDDVFGFDTKISMKRAGESDFWFSVNEKKERLVPISENEPLEAIEHLMNYEIIIHENQLFLRISDTGQ